MKKISLFIAVLVAVSIAVMGSCSKGKGSTQSSSPPPHDIHGISFVSIPGGTFQMGNVENDSNGNSNEKPVHMVTVSSFDMSVCEITNTRYAKYLNEALASGNVKVTNKGVEGTKGTFSGQGYIYFTHGPDKCWITYSGGIFVVMSGKENWPVVFVTWYGAKAFALYYGLDLPTEAEWEHACRGGRQYKYGTDDGTINSKKANYNVTFTHPVDVGSYPKNPFGLCDMSGNSAEWCHDLSGRYSSESVTNPIGTLTGSYRVVRGGSWIVVGGGPTCRSAYRGRGCPPGIRSPDIGFRVVSRVSPQSY